MRLRIGIGVARDEHDLFGEALERLVHALRRLAGLVQIAHRRAVGAFFLLALIGEHVAADDFLRRAERGRAGVAEAVVRVAAGGGAGDDGANAEDRREDHLGLRPRELLAQLGQMAAGDMPGLMREHADDLVRRLRFHQRAGIDEDAAAVDDEGVEGRLVDDDDLHVLLGETGGAQQRRGVVAQQLLDLRVADDRRALAAPAPAPATGSGASGSAAAVTSAVARAKRERKPRREYRTPKRSYRSFRDRPHLKRRELRRNVGPACADRYIAGFGSRANTLNALELRSLPSRRIRQHGGANGSLPDPFKRTAHCSKRQSPDR